ncbi:MAG: divalent metal cation transporter [Phycisphaerae bacterium]|nr:divalent metal cation transporter [Phycisphaerae bacterium]
MTEQSQDTQAGAERSAIARDRQLLVDARKKGKVSLFGAFVKLSGPGWLQSAITLGSGSLAGALYLGILGGLAFLWLQPLAMIMGVIMLSAIGYVTLSTGEKPFRAINKHVNPVLGWGWIIATMLANLIWCLPQYSVGTAAVRQNLLPKLVGAEAMTAMQWPDWVGNAIVVAAITILCVVVVIFYDKGRKGIRILEWILKGMVGVIVVSFIGVVVVMSLSAQGLDWGQIGAGLIPDLGLLSRPAGTFDAALGAVGEQFRNFWSNEIVSQQRDVMISAAATAVGINMTFLLPYSMLKKGWDKTFRGLAIFDLSTGLFIPFILVTGCVVIAASAQFHNKPAEGVLEGTAPAGVMNKYHKVAGKRLEREIGKDEFKKLAKDKDELDQRISALPEADRRMAAMLVKRDAFDMAKSLSPLTGKHFANYVFGIGVVGMAISSIIVLMLINGFVICEMVGVESRGLLYRFGALMPAAVGLLGPFIWSGKAQFWLAVPTSVFGMVLIPIAYFTFFLLMNQKSLLGENRPRGMKRLMWNVLMFVAAGLAAMGSFWSLWSKLKVWGIVIFAGFVVLAVVVQIVRKKPQSQPQ